ncbi:Uncharacterised protein [Chlamydia trachomatis]|nr:Uncharacterised protein [Chlamydia trachomatis]
MMVVLLLMVNIKLILLILMAGIQFHQVMVEVGLTLNGLILILLVLMQLMMFQELLLLKVVIH